MVLPEPGPPTTKVVRPLGKPPSVISSRPRMPVGALAIPRARGERTGFIYLPCGSELRRPVQKDLRRRKRPQLLRACRLLIYPACALGDSHGEPGSRL